MPTPPNAATAAASPAPARFWARLVSILAALAVSAVLLLYPYALGTEMTPRVHAALPLLLIGVCAAFVHGLGFRPDSRTLRVVFGPAVAWPLIAAGTFLLAAP
jgi:predicted membrane protein